MYRVVRNRDGGGAVRCAQRLLQLPDVAQRFAPAEAARQRLLALWRGVLPPGDDRVADLYRLVWGTVHGLAGFVVERVFQLVRTDDERIAAADVAIDMLVESLRARAALGASRQERGRAR